MTKQATTRELPSAGGCYYRVATTFISRHHRDAPPGLSRCTICLRLVVRGAGRWWEA